MLPLVDLIGTCLLLIFLFIFCVPLSIITIIKLHQNWNETLFIKRRRSIIVTLLGCEITILFTEMLIDCIALLIVQSESILNGPKLNVVLYFGRSIFLLLFLIYIARIYILYFDHMLQSALNNQQWKSLLWRRNKSLIGDKNELERKLIDEVTGEWFIQHRHTYGNTKYMLKLVIYLWLGLLIVYIFCVEVRYLVPSSIVDSIRPAWIFQIVCCISAVAFCVRIWRKYPVLNDRFCIRLEFILVVKSSFFWLCVGIVIFAIFAIFSFDLYFVVKRF